jgi:catechol 2,3-dioxygenase-like lactoylglutathione lyase family enzyme
MSTIDVSSETSVQAPDTGTVDFKFELVVVPVANVDRAKSFYQGLGWRLDADIAVGDDYHAVQMTPPGSNASILFGKGVTSDAPGSIGSMLLAVDDINAARDELISHGLDVEVFHDAGGSLGGGFIANKTSRAPGPDPERRSYATYASFSDPDGNSWLLQEITERLPGRV